MLKSLMVLPLRHVWITAGLALSMIQTASAQITTKLPWMHDFMVDNSPLKAEELRKAFKGRTHEGFYRFERDEIPTTRFTETTRSDGRVKHVQGEETLTGTWEIEGDQICFQYEDVWKNTYCFDIYRVGTCYYHYIRTSNGIPVNRWTARSTPKGEVPDCDIAIS